MIVGGQHFDVLELVEDETIMALPFAPSHDACGLPADVAAADSQADEAVTERRQARSGVRGPRAACGNAAGRGDS